MAILNNIEVKSKTHIFLKRLAKDKSRSMRVQTGLYLDEVVEQREQEGDGSTNS